MDNFMEKVRFPFIMELVLLEHGILISFKLTCKLLTKIMINMKEN